MTARWSGGWLALALSLVAAPAVAQSPPRTAPAPATPAVPPAPSPPAPLGTAPLPIGRGAAALTLPAAEQMLVENNLAIIAARKGVDAAWAQRLVNSSLPPPTLTAGNTYAQFNESNKQSFAGARFLAPTNNIAAGLSVLVERGGKRTLRTRVAEEQIGVAEAQVLDTIRGQLFALRQGFLGALLARANLEVALANRVSLDRTEALLRRQLRDGAIPEGDLLRFQASRLQFESDVTNNAQAYAAGIAALAALLSADPTQFDAAAGTLRSMGINPPVPPALGPVPQPVPALVEPHRRAERRAGAPTPAAAPTTVQLVLSPVAFDVRGRFDAVPELGIARDELARGIDSRPDVVVATRQAAAANQNRLLAEAARSRDVTLNAGWGRSRLSQNVPNAPDGATYHANDQFTVNLSIPIFTRRITEGNVGIASAQQAQAEAGAKATLLQARADFATAWAAYEQSLALLRLYTGGALNRAEEAYRSTEAAYQAGGRSLLEVMDALRTLNATRIAANQARYAYLLALAQLEQASGVAGIAPRL
jgi:outer membrane protein TolC